MMGFTEVAKGRAQQIEEVASIFETDVTPVQVARTKPASGERAMWRAILRDALDVARGKTTPSDSHGRADALLWIRTVDEDRCGGFDWVCNLLMLDPSWMRARYARDCGVALEPLLRAERCCEAGDADASRLSDVPGPVQRYRAAVEEVLKTWQRAEVTVRALRRVLPEIAARDLRVVLKAIADDGDLLVIRGTSHGVSGVWIRNDEEPPPASDTGPLGHGARVPFVAVLEGEG